MQTKSIVISSELFVLTQHAILCGGDFGSLRKFPSELLNLPTQNALILLILFLSQIKVALQALFSEYCFFKLFLHTFSASCAVL